MKKVLIIEDNENNMELLSFMLKSEGHEVLQAFNGRDGIDMAKKNKPDLILLDIQLPDIDGIEVLGELRSDGDFADTPVAAVTSYAMSGDSKKLLDAGCDGYIEKPIDPDTFLNQINSLFN